MKQMLAIFMGAVIASLVVSCAETTPGETTPDEPTIRPTPIPSATISQKSPDITPVEALIEYHRQGGFAGFDDYLLLDATRQAIIVRKNGRHEITLDATSFEGILQQLDQARFSDLQKEYLPASTCCDLIEYAITYKGHTVRTMDTAVPEALQPVLDLLNEVVETAMQQ